MAVTDKVDVRARIVRDPDPEFDWDDYQEIFQMYTWHRRYQLGPEHDYTRDEVRELFDNDRYYFFDLYMYEHGNIALSLSPFSCHWDSGVVGYIVASKDDLQTQFGFDLQDEDVVSKVKDFLESHLDECTSYINGEVYGVVVETRKRGDCECCSRAFEWERYDDCYGFFGVDPATNGLSQTIKDMTAHFDNVEVIDVV